jgi:hypothetical protein
MQTPTWMILSHHWSGIQIVANNSQRSAGQIQRPGLSQFQSGSFMRAREERGMLGWQLKALQRLQDLTPLSLTTPRANAGARQPLAQDSTLLPQDPATFVKALFGQERLQQPNHVGCICRQLWSRQRR